MKYCPGQVQVCVSCGWSPGKEWRPGRLVKSQPGWREQELECGTMQSESGHTDRSVSLWHNSCQCAFHRKHEALLTCSLLVLSLGFLALTCRKGISDWCSGGTVHPEAKVQVGPLSVAFKFTLFLIRATRCLCHCVKQCRP